MIVEGLVTTLNDDGTTNVSPMGPITDDSLTWLRLRPFQTSRTYRNLKRTQQGVFHVMDDAELLARAAIDRWNEPPRTVQATCVDGQILAEACSWYAFRVTAWNDRDERSSIECRVVGSGFLRGFRGWNRASHAVLEAAILATRVHLIPIDEIREEFARLRVIVDKTAGEREHRAFELLKDYVEEQAANEKHERWSC